MPHYYFDVRTAGQPWSADEQGVSFPDSRQARQEALTLALDLARQRPPERELEVRVRSDEVVAVVRLVLVVELPEHEQRAD